ncbi:MAG: type II toxin-antitoxin system VapC family toxin [Planctomycetes bacterium]|nr:type II toxin-antitoxin system VapC family toxin [Planctomycetota bacterium]
MKPRVYVETSVISYLTAKPSRDVIVLAHQQITREWWERDRDRFDLYISQVVIREASAGDPEAAQERLEASKGIPLLDITDAATALGKALTDRGVIPVAHTEDALHIAVATVHGMDYLVTWNCAHIANAQLRAAVEKVCTEHGFRLPIICTPEELTGGLGHVEGPNR